MSEYIERKLALSEICAGCGIEFPCDPCEPCDCAIKARLEAIPAADVVEVRHEPYMVLSTVDVAAVVRCRDCVYNRGETKDLWGNPAIKCVTAVTHEPDWYCASGKHKDGGQDDGTA